MTCIHVDTGEIWSSDGALKCIRVLDNYKTEFCVLIVILICQILYYKSIIIVIFRPNIFTAHREDTKAEKSRNTAVGN